MTELFTWSTSNGLYGTAGGPKSLQLSIEHYYKYVNNAITRYGTDVAANNGNPVYRIQPNDGISGDQVIRDAYSVQANLYYQRTDFKSIYMRTASGAPGFPVSPEGGGYYPWGGGSGKFPAMLFMFGQMEGKVWPYPAGGLNPNSQSHRDPAQSLPANPQRSLGPRATRHHVLRPMDGRGQNPRREHRPSRQLKRRPTP